MQMIPPLLQVEVDFAKACLNGLFQARKRLARIAGTESAERALESVEEAFRSAWVRAEHGYSVTDPKGQKYSETRTDVEASLSGESNANLRIVETMRPIITLHLRDPDGQATSVIVQKGQVVVRSSDETTSQAKGSES